MTEQDRRDATRVFRALAVEKRVEIVQLLSGRALCVGALSHMLGISAGAVSQHLRILKDAGIVEADRRGYFVHYSLAPGAHGECREIMDSLFGKEAERGKGGGICARQTPSVRNRKS